MKPRYFVVCTLVLALAVSAFAQPKHPMKPGKWQVNMQMEMPGMPFKMPPVSKTTCVTAEQLEKDPQSTIPKDKKSDCKVSDYELDGNTVTWTMTCPKDNMTGEGTLTFSEEKYTGSMNMKMGEQEMLMKYTGKRLGECDKD